MNDNDFDFNNIKDEYLECSLCDYKGKKRQKNTINIKIKRDLISPSY